METIITKKRLFTYSLSLIPRKSSGFTLIEALVVLVIISAISTFGLMRLRAFQKDAILDSTANEIVSAIRTAQNKSESGEVPEGCSLDQFEDNGPPYYGLKATDIDGSGLFHSYEQYVVFTLKSGEVCNATVFLKNELPPEITTNGFDISFYRLTGKSTSGAVDVNLVYKSGSTEQQTRKVTFNSDGVIIVSEP